MHDPIRQPFPVVAYSNFLQHLEAGSSDEPLVFSELLDLSRWYLRSKKGIAHQYIIAEKTRFLSFIFGRIRYKMPYLPLVRRNCFKKAFLAEVMIVTKQLSKHYFVPGIQKVLVKEVVASKLYALLRNGCTDPYRSKLEADAASLFHKNQVKHQGVNLNLSYEVERICVGLAVRDAILFLVNFVGAEHVTPLSMLDQALEAQVKQICLTLKKHVKKHPGTVVTLRMIKHILLEKQNAKEMVSAEISQPASQKVVRKPPCDKETADIIVHLQEIINGSHAQQFLDMARDHFRMVKLMNRQASILLQSISAEEFVKCVLETTVKELERNTETSQFVPFLTVESTIKSEVERLFEKTVQILKPLAHKEKHPSTEAILDTTVQDDLARQQNKENISSTGISQSADQKVVVEDTIKSEVEWLFKKNEQPQQSQSWTPGEKENSLVTEKCAPVDFQCFRSDLLEGKPTFAEQLKCSVPAPVESAVQNCQSTEMSHSSSASQMPFGNEAPDVNEILPKCDVSEFAHQYLDAEDWSSVKIEPDLEMLTAEEDPLCDTPNLSWSDNFAPFSSMSSPDVAGLPSNKGMEIGLSSCPVRGCSYSSSGFWSFLKVLGHLYRDHVFSGLQGPHLERCGSCNQILNKTNRLNHYCRHHYNFLDYQIRHLLISQLALHFYDCTRCPFCKGFLNSQFFSRKLGQSLVFRLFSDQIATMVEKNAAVRSKLPFCPFANHIPYLTIFL